VKVTGYRSLTTKHDWGRLIGDANGVMSEPRTDVHVLILETDEGLEGVGVGAHGDIGRVFGAVEGEDPRADANESWNRTQAVRFVTALERRVDLTWIEEPVRRWDTAGLAAVRHGIRVDEARIAALQLTDSLVAVAGPHVRPSRAGLRLTLDGHREERLGAPPAGATAGATA